MDIYYYQGDMAYGNKCKWKDNIGQKMVTLAQAWKEAYQVSGSKDNGMQKVLSMLNAMFNVQN